MKSKKPLIGILTNLYTVEKGIFAGQERVYVNRDYVNAILDAGGIPLLLPIIPEKEAILRQVESVDAILLSGGQDLHPRHYKEEPSHYLEAILPERDEYEMIALRHAFALKKPIFGVCRGLQLINVAFGGSLYQDIANHFPNHTLQHSQKAKSDEASHTVDVVSNSHLFNIVEKKILLTNSFHHQAIKELAPGFKANAIAKDGVIEGIESEDSSFVLAVQWHPEMMVNKCSDMKKLFKAFIEEAR